MQELTADYCFSGEGRVPESLGPSYPGAQAQKEEHLLLSLQGAALSSETIRSVPRGRAASGILGNHLCVNLSPWMCFTEPSRATDNTEGWQVAGHGDAGAHLKAPAHRSAPGNSLSRVLSTD